MAKTLLLAEKPSQAQDIAKGLGEAFSKKDGYLESFQYLITWCFGHLVELEDAEAYDIRFAKWDLAALPIFPDEFRYRVKPAARKQFRVIKDLLDAPDIRDVVVCTDPGREGELIARLVLRLAGNKKPVRRFWSSKALTPSTVRAEFAKLKDVAEFDRLYLSAVLRQQADWVIGINATRAFTAILGDIYSVGRVQTPTLRIIVDREMAIRDFKPVDYWTVMAEFEHPNGRYGGNWIPSDSQLTGISGGRAEDDDEEEGRRDVNSGGKLFRGEDAEAIAKRVKGQRGSIVSVREENREEVPPQLFSLTDLQKEANRRYGFSAKDTLDIAQSLYEKHKALSYPRTESRHLNTEMVADVRQVLEVLGESGLVKFSLGKVSVGATDKRVFDDEKLTDHHALIPTGNIPATPSEDESKVYELVVRRFVSAFYPPRKYRNTSVVTAVGNDRFLTGGVTVLNAGWCEIYGGGGKEQILPAVVEKDGVSTVLAEAAKKRTTPPPRHTDASILSAMTNAQRFVTDPKLKSVLKETAGLGTPATRAAILESLVKRQYLQKSGKHLVPTEKGVFLINNLQGEKIADPAYTAVWEQALEGVAVGGEARPREFMEGIKGYTAEIVAKARQMAGEAGTRAPKAVGGDAHEGKVIGQCPRCQGEVYEREKGFQCAGYSLGREKAHPDGNKGCDFILWKNSLSALGKRTITAGQAATLLTGETIELKGLKSKKSGKPFSAGGKLSRHEKYGWQVELILGLASKYQERS
ncbi:MAG: DNA topoisomerase 3 [Nitrospinae bacterium]|nr:DNA topoisomerase 3 [Nitrospinota bacterium]